ncbi:MAG: universal stress protein [Rubripirellula sp.]|jgi:universal stress protein A|nr:universal stress protein [Rubripirellula sp.]
MTEITPLQEILVPVDFSECSIHALRFAQRVAAGSNSRLHLLYVDDDPILMDAATDQSFRDEHEDKMSMRFVNLMPVEDRERFRTVMAIQLGTAYQMIEDYAREKEIDMIVMGNVGRSALADAVLGSVTAHVIRHADCPVLSVQLPR